ncbi:genetic competence negative regulator [Pasteuria penetrans]|uniref:genetic competence negative regulator n=1 Tax=Pasteuria penetrans TaxID=86005 RepID=UPI000FC3190F|nr:genetic competence negative regulator [Pasteuria penetrans]
MRVERLGGDKIRFFLTLDDLVDRGIEREDMWRDIPKVHELFNDMMEHAYQELGFEVAGPIAVEVFALPTQGMVVVVTRGRPTVPENEDFDRSEDMYELEVTMEEAEDVLFRFSDFEYLVQAAVRLHPHVEQGGQVYAYNGNYYLVFNRELISDRLDAVVAVLSEFGEASTLAKAFLSEYGKTVWSKDSISEIVHHFG